MRIDRFVNDIPALSRTESDAAIAAGDALATIARDITSPLASWSSNSTGTASSTNTANDTCAAVGGFTPFPGPFTFA